MRCLRITFSTTDAGCGRSRSLDSEMWLARSAPLASPLWRPPADLVETRDAYHLSIELPGVADDDMDVLVHRDAVVVVGRRRCRGLEGAIYHAAEIRYGPFRFETVLPTDADARRTDATYDRGVLLLVVPKRTGDPK